MQIINATCGELTTEDVGKRNLIAFGHVWPVVDFMGQILPGDVGKRIYLVGSILQVENDQQRDDRQSGKKWTFHDTDLDTCEDCGYPMHRCQCE